ncbi:MAG: MFS transporter [Actinomycetota bacterium]
MSISDSPPDPAVTPESFTGSALAANEGVSRKKIISWAMWDWGTQPFNTVITTFVFSVYITSSAFGSENHTSQSLATSTTIAGLFIAVLAPVLGQNADRRGAKLKSLRYLTWALAAISASLYVVRPDPSYLWVGLILLGVGSVVGEIAGVSYNALLDDVATEKNVGRVSGFGWGMGYLGGILVLLLIYFLFIQPDVGLFGITGEDGMDIRVSMLVCGLWTLIFTVPTFLNLKERPRTNLSPATGVMDSYRELGRSVKRIWRASPHTIYFLFASALFRDGLAGVFAFGAVIAAGTFGFTAGEVIIFGAAANIVAGLSTMAFGMLDDKIGPKRVILISLVSLVILGIAIFFLYDQGAIVFWICGMLMTVFVGPAQSASRTFLARLIPVGRAGEIFGLYATTGRVVSFMSPAAFGLMIGLGALVTGKENTQYWGILGIVVVLLAGLIVMIPVKQQQRQIT